MFYHFYCLLFSFLNLTPLGLDIKFMGNTMQELKDEGVQSWRDIIRPAPYDWPKEFTEANHLNLSLHRVITNLPKME